MHISISSSCLALLLTFFSTGASADTTAQTPGGTPMRTVELKLDAQHHIEQTYLGPRLLYLGGYTCIHLQRCGPEGRHYVFARDGRLQRVIDYRFSSTRQFEGVPDTEWTATLFDSQGRVAQIMHVTQCTECDPKPIGEWRYFRAGKLQRRVRAEAESTPADQSEILYREAANTDYWPGLGPRPTGWPH